MGNRPPIGQVEGKKVAVEDMFDAIAPRYDLLNRVLSLGVDQYWRKRAIALLAAENPQRILDVATGTADLALQAMTLEPKKVIGVDISEEMLSYGREKIAAKGLEDRISLRRGDAEKLPFSDNQFDAVLVAFGVRNFENLDQGLAEIRRVLKPGGSLVVLEFSQPHVFPIKQFYNFYSKHILPRIGRRVSKDTGAYDYLPESIRAFPAGAAFLGHLKAAGYTNAFDVPLTFGIVSLYKGTA